MIKRIILNYELECVTGLQIHAGNSSFDIGGVDNPVIKDALTNEPYIPGSSLKGKLRSLLEWVECPERLCQNNGKVINDFNTLPGQLFGIAPNSRAEIKENINTRLIVRDAFITAESKDFLAKKLGQGVYTEIKPENSINRLSSKATPRFFERVPRGVCFSGEMVLTIYEQDDEQKLLNGLYEAMRLLQDNYLGSGGSRGSGKVRFNKITKIERTKADYIKGNDQVSAESITL